MRINVYLSYILGCSYHRSHSMNFYFILDLNKFNPLINGVFSEVLCKYYAWVLVASPSFYISQSCDGQKLPSRCLLDVPGYKHLTI